MSSLNSCYSVVSSDSKAPLKEDTERSVTWKDVQLILPTLMILLFTVLVMVTVIPYAFSTVFRQMEAVRALEAAGEIDQELKVYVLKILLVLAAMSKSMAQEKANQAAEGISQGINNFTKDLCKKSC